MVFSGLVELCLRVVVGAQKLHDPQSFKYLPRHLKDYIREVVLKRYSVTPAILESLLHNSVREINMENQEELTNELVTMLAQIKTFRKINFNRIAHIDKRTHPSMLENPEPIPSTVSAESLIRLISGQRYLTSLFLRGLSGLSVELFTCISSSCLHLANIDVGHCPGLEDQHVLQLRIESLSLAGLDITDSALHELARSGSKDTIKELRIDGCKHITDLGIQFLLDGLGALEILIFHGCPQVTNNSRVSLQVYLSTHRRNVRQLTWTVY
ncbi:protein AMN1 homolog isoform X2 [Eurytemora carolleeae]|uniref:protein AMN1 homolog isoform X2 n=1 Tax=Eurytemora carolleeae TaxID=1294199 RepID=UPI000C78D078|nr:protein AMN1 homolog isoform X2 [Eurytemora carolleeae]|eukprot:XP_023338289.1 protein AMN1 homolog isoform X2 [Eurytemora affinis]